MRTISLPYPGNWNSPRSSAKALLLTTTESTNSPRMLCHPASFWPRESVIVLTIWHLLFHPWEVFFPSCGEKLVMTCHYVNVHPTGSFFLRPVSSLLPIPLALKYTDYVADYGRRRGKLALLKSGRLDSETVNCRQMVMSSLLTFVVLRFKDLFDRLSCLDFAPGPSSYFAVSI